MRNPLLPNATTGFPLSEIARLEKTLAALSIVLISDSLQLELAHTALSLGSDALALRRGLSAQVAALTAGD